MTFEICKICQLGAGPRVRLAARRSTSAVDMFTRETDVTFTLFSSGNAQHAVLRKMGTAPVLIVSKYCSKHVVAALAFWPVSPSASNMEDNGIPYKTCAYSRRS